MSNIIPIVSSSPPPIDDGSSFGWDDDDDDFGNFASAPGIEPAICSQDDKGEAEFDADWSQPGSVHSESRENSPDDPESDCKMQNTNLHDESSVLGNKNMNESCVPKDEVNDCHMIDDEFANFETFQEESSRKGKPTVGSLPLKNIHQDRLEDDQDSDSSVVKAIETIMEKSRESTATDSGIFSTDISPIPRSEISEGDKTVQSEDETFSDTPQDSQIEVSENERIADQTPDLFEKKGECDGDVSSESCPDDLGNENDVTKVEEENNVKMQEDMEVSSVPLHQSMPDGSGLLNSDEQYNSDINTSDRIVTDSNNHTEVNSEQDVSMAGTAETAPSSDQSVTVSNKENSFSKSEETSHNGNDGAFDDDVEGDWAAFETSDSSPPFHSESKDDTDHQQNTEPEDLVLRKDSINFDDEDMSGVSSDDTSETPKSGRDSCKVQTGEVDSEDGREVITTFTDSYNGSSRSKSAEGGEGEIGDISRNPSESETIPSKVDLREKSTSKEEADDEFGDFSVTTDLSNSSHIPSPQPTNGHSDSPVSAINVSRQEDDEFGDFSNQTFSNFDIPQTKPRSENSGERSEEEKVIDNVDNTNFGDFSSRQASGERQEEDDYGSFSERIANNDEDDDDDFGDFNSGSFSSAPVSSSNTDDFGAFSGKSVGGNDADEFGDFSEGAGTASAPADSGWANFSEPSKSVVDENDEFGNFSDAKPNSGQDTFQASTSSSADQDSQGNKLETSLKGCFPSSAKLSQSELACDSVNDEPNTCDTTSSDKTQLGTLETILKYGLHYRSASQQTWQVVQHPSKKDPRVRLWGHLQDVDGSPAVIYQWNKSSTNSHLFLTLHIDTQNMLIGHKKPSVPIFATGLSLLEPIRGGRKDRGLGVVGQPEQGNISPVLTPTLVDPNQQEAERPSQEIPAVDFDWSTSGLTNPLTSKSLDLDFLVAQDSQASDKPSVFQSEILDAPRSSVKSSQPLEDILKSVKPTSVRSRRDEAVNSRMSPEALRVLAGLPDLSFMQSKVLMFPIKN